MKNVSLILIVAFIVGCGSSSSSSSDEQEKSNSFELLQTIDITQYLSKDTNISKVGRPDVVAIGEELYLAYSIITQRNHHLVQIKPNLDLTFTYSSPLELFSGYHDFSVDIRVSSANNRLWYAFEDNKFGDISNMVGEDEDNQSRIAHTSNKRNPKDFALWKSCKGYYSNIS